MTTTTATLKVPGKSYMFSRDTTAEERAKFEIAIIDLLNKEVPEWEQYTKLDWSHEFFRIMEKYSYSKAIISIKRGGDFVFTKARKEKLIVYITQTMEHEAAQRMHRSEADNLQSIVEPILNKYESDEIKTYFDRSSFRITLSLTKDRWNYFAKATINRKGQVLVECENCRISTIEQAEEYINTYKAHADKIKGIAASIISELPKEYFI